MWWDCSCMTGLAILFNGSICYKNVHKPLLLETVWSALGLRQFVKANSLLYSWSLRYRLYLKGVCRLMARNPLGLNCSRLFWKQYGYEHFWTISNCSQVFSTDYLYFQYLPCLLLHVLMLSPMDLLYLGQIYIKPHNTNLTSFGFKHLR